MATQLNREIRQDKPFAALEQEAYLNLVRTSNLVWQGLAELLRGHGLTPTQYNALRILRGAGAEGRTSGEVGERMVSFESDVTRLLDRLEKAGLIERWRTSEDRRVVRAKITPAGQELLDSLDEPVMALHRRQFGCLTPDELATLVSLLERTRDTCYC